jgi:hypothetical protein
VRAERAAEVAALAADVERLQGESAHWRTELDALRESFSEAAAEAEQTRDRHRAEIAAVERELRAERAAVAELQAELAARPDPPPPLTGMARRAAAAAPPTEELRAPTEDTPEPTAPEIQGEDTTEPMPPTAPADTTEPMAPPIRDKDSTEPMPPAGPAPTTAAARPARGLTGPTGSAELADQPAEPGPLRAGSRATREPASEDGARAGRMIPAWLRTGEDTERDADAGDEQVETAAVTDASPGGATPLQALKERLENLFAPNGHAAAAEPEIDDDVGLPRPRRSAAAARARAGATVAARRSPAELWTARILAVVLVAVLLLAFLLILTHVV